MKLKVGIILLLLIAAINISAQTKSVLQKVAESETVLAASHPIDPQPLIDRFNKANGIDPTKFVTEPAQLKKVTTYKVGDTKNLWSSNFVTNKFYLSPSTCRAVGSNCYIFVEDSMWTTDRVNQSAVDAVMNAFDNSTPANAAKGIYQTNVETFGNPPNIDGDSKIIIHILNIPDGYSGQPGEGYVAGYFYSYNQQTSASYPYSNKAEIYYLDSKPLNLLTASGLNTGMGTAAHEFQHMIQYNYHPGGQVTFFNEAWSLVAEVVCGYGLYGQSGTQGYSNNTNRYLLNWNSSDGTDVLKDYSRAARFALYLYEQFGIDILKKFTQSVKTGIEAFDNDVFPKLGTTRRFADVLADWFVANYVNDKSVDSKWGYTYTPLVKVTPTSASLSSSVSSKEDAIYKSAAQYISFTSGKNLTINFNRGTNTAIKVKAVKIGTGTPQVVDVATNTNVNFSDFGTAYNALTFIVYHNDINALVTGPFNYTYSYSGTTSTVTQEVKFDEADNVASLGAFGLTANDTVAVLFNGAAGMKLKKIKVGLRNDKQITGKIYSLGSTLTRPLNKALSTSFTLTGLSSPVKPFPVPWPNMVEYDLTNSNIDVSNGFAVAFVYGGATGNNIAVVEHTPKEFFNSMTYMQVPGGDSPAGWYWLTTSETASALYIMRAYITNDLTGIEEEIEIIPSSFTLSQNYPNPFNPSTVISYQLPKQSRVQIKIYDAIGNEIRSLIDEEKSAGKYNILWDSRNNYGSRVSSGVYFYKITADGFAQTKKMILMK